jgi:hypothetical protein
MEMEQSVPKGLPAKFRGRRNTQKKEYMKRDSKFSGD